MHRRIECSRLAALTAMVSACTSLDLQTHDQEEVPPSATIASSVTLPPRPLFQLPFPCGQQWVLFSYPGHNPDNLKIDMQRLDGTTRGSPVVASLAGTVHSWGDPGGIEIDHGGGWFSLYLHMTDRAVQPGQHVDQGQQIGLTGSVGTEVPHLHYELRFDFNSNGDSTNSEIVVASFDGVEYDMGANGEKSFNLVSRNCGAPAAAPVSEAARAHGDFNGDGFDDIGAFYDYGGGRTKLWLWYGTASGFAAPVMVWDGGANNWYLPQSRFIAGDFNGDGKGDIGGFYDYGAGTTKLWVWRGAASGFAGPVQMWESGAGNWTMSRSRFVVGDFDGDRHADIGGFYDYGASTTGLWIWRGSDGAFTTPVQIWNSGANGWALAQSRLVSGDFNGDGKSDIGGFYDYGAATAKLWVWRGTATGFAAPAVMWESLANGWNLAQSRPITGDFNGDGKVDVGALYDYGSATTRLWVWRGTSGGFAEPAITWDGGANNWNLSQSRFTTGDFDGDGKTDVGAFYDYGSGTTKLWMWRGATNGINPATEKWNSGPNSWVMTQSRIL